jgi:CubicO group peptidase (beta-lactamase class C family)
MGPFLLVFALATAPEAELVGLWEAKRHFGPEVRGSLELVPREGALEARIAGHSAPVTTTGERSEFRLPDGRGAFRGRLVSRGELAGFWIQPASPLSGAEYATPVSLRYVDGRWRGEVKPLEQAFSYYLPVALGKEGVLETYLRNPERNVGVFTRVKRLEREGERVRLIGSSGGRAGDETLFEGRFEGGRLTVPFPSRGGDYEFAKTGAATSFYPRGKEPSRYRYAPPPALGDGWPVANLEEVGMSRSAIEAFVQNLIDAPMASVHASQIHSVLIARHGKLVLEEYFHGHRGDQAHDTRSAAKSLASALVGAAMQAGIKVSESTPVYETMLGTVPSGLDPRKRAMTLGHLLTMTGGHFCDDNNDDAPGNENTLQEQTREPDWYRFILALPMDRTPGEKLVYCSIDAHLAGGVLAKAAGEPLPELFDRLIGRPLRMGPYHVMLAPTGDAYMGGGWHLTARDFLKVAQLMGTGGTWQGTRIFSEEWARKSGAPLRDIMRGQKYGYLWNSSEYPYRGRTVRGIFAAGNGGQIFMAIPELGLAIAFTGGNYSDAALFIPQRKLIPEHILPAVSEAGVH